jgi:uncharacterized protein Veg
MATRHNVLSNIKTGLDGLVGQRVLIRANKGRRKIVEREGTLEKTYTNHFIVRLDEDRQSRLVSYSYADLLTEIVELSLCCQDGRQKFEVSAS